MKVIKGSNLVFCIVLIFGLVAKISFANNTVEKKQVSKSAKHKNRKNIVFLITKDPDNYQADSTVPLFAQMLNEKHGYNATVLLGNGPKGAYTYPNFELIEQADLVVVFARRIALPHQQMNILKQYLSSGKPLMGIRTANHAFTTREKIAEGYEDWPGFVADILGCENRGYGPVEPGTDVTVVPSAKKHPIVKNVSSTWHSKGNIYLVAPLLDSSANIVLEGKINNIIQPIAWTRFAEKSRIFYTSLGHSTDFDTPQFTTLLLNAVNWCIQK